MTTRLICGTEGRPPNADVWVDCGMQQSHYQIVVVSFMTVMKDMALVLLLWLNFKMVLSPNNPKYKAPHQTSEMPFTISGCCKYPT